MYKLPNSFEKIKGSLKHDNNINGSQKTVSKSHLPKPFAPYFT